MTSESQASDNPREWARPGPEGDVWHDYWEPEETRHLRRPLLRDLPPAEKAYEREARRRLGRKLAVIYLTVVPIAIASNLIFNQYYNTPVSAIVGATLCTVGLIRILLYGERSWVVILPVAAFIPIWIILAAIRTG